MQSPGNRIYFHDWLKSGAGQLEVLQNWLAKRAPTGCPIDVKGSKLAGRKIFVYAGNMGVAQGMDSLLRLAELLKFRRDIGFLFVGRGSHLHLLQSTVTEKQLDNVALFDEVEPDQIPGLYAQCHVGLVALDRRHQTHNIPGKFLSYIQSGLPVLASINPGNDLVELIETERVGRAVVNSSDEHLARQAEALVADLERDASIAVRCRELADRLFSPETAATQIVAGLVQQRYADQRLTSAATTPEP